MGARKVNDLHTAELTFELAARTGAAALINRAEDRNRLDLNRVSDVRSRAPWFLDLLLARVRAQIAARGEALVVFVHGWNAIQPTCDVGIGVRARAGRFEAVGRSRMTIAPELLPRLLEMRATCRRDGIDVTFGDRYPGAGRENMLQVFTARYADDSEPRIRELARLGADNRVSAVQLELAVPLRWPGRLRQRMAGAIAALVRRSAVAGIDGVERSDPDPRGEWARERMALDFHDGRAGVGGFAGVERLESGRRQGRLLLCLGATRLVLFTGEDGRAATTLRCQGISWTRVKDGSGVLEYDGPCLAFPRTDPFLDLEDGLADAELCDLRARLEWHPAPPRQAARGLRVGHVSGELRTRGSKTAIAAAATLQEGFFAEVGGWRERRLLRIPVGSDGFLDVSSRAGTEEIAEGRLHRGGSCEPLFSARVSLAKAPDGLTPEAWRVDAVSRSGPLRVFGRVTHAVPVVRPSREGRVLTHFGLGRFDVGGEPGFGTFELAQRVREPRENAAAADGKDER